MSALSRLHRWLPWLLAAGFVVAVESWCARTGLAGEAHWLIRITAGSTLVVLLAVRRAWLHDRGGLECVGYGAIAPAALLAAAVLPPTLRVLPAFALACGLPVYTAWRFLPDHGQRGRAWAVAPGLHRALAPLALLAFAAALLPGCRKADSARAPAPPAHAITGEIVGVTPDRGVLLVHHDEIPGYMPSMTMEFAVPGSDLGAFREGRRIAARMIEGAPGEFRLEGVRILDATTDGIVAASAQALRQETLIRGKRVYREIGEDAPQFTLYDQDGRVVSFDRFRGRRVVLNFIFTRCPVPTMCPASTAKMMALQAAAQARGIANLEFVSITLDPAYDTPAVLKRYASGRGIDLRNFTFLTGPENAVRDLLTGFGVLVAPGENIFKHTLATVLIDEHGRILHRVDGSGWTPEDFLRRL